MTMRLPAKRAIARTVYEEARSFTPTVRIRFVANGTHSTRLAPALAWLRVHTFTAACWSREATCGTTVVNT